MELQEKFNDRMTTYLELIAREGIHNAAKGFSGMLGQELSVEDPVVTLIPLFEISNEIAGPEDEVVGIYLRAEGEMVTQFMMVIPYQRALELVDLLMDEPLGTTQVMGSLERSALAEVGNLTASFFMNSLANISGLSLRPTPPAVMVDMAGAIIDIIIATTGGISEYVMMLKTKFILNHREVETDFWVIPDETTLKLLAMRV